MVSLIDKLVMFMIIKLGNDNSKISGSLTKYFTYYCRFCNKRIVCTENNYKCFKQQGCYPCVCNDCAVNELEIFRDICPTSSLVRYINEMLKCANLPLRVRNEAKRLYILKTLS